MNVILGTVLLCALLSPSDASPMQRMERTVISKMRMADLESSASGYAYNQQHGSPVSYVQYTDHGSQRYYDVPFSVHNTATDEAVPVARVIPKAALQYGPGAVAYVTAAPEFPPYVEYRTSVKTATPETQQLPVYVAPAAKLEALAPYYVPAILESKVHEDGAHDEDDKVEEEGNDESDEEEDEEDEEDDDDDDEDDDDESYETGDGAQHDANEHSVGGEGGDSGYKNYHKFNKGEQEHHDDEHQTGHYSDEDGSKKSHIDSAGNYGEHEELEKGKEGSNFGDASYRKKGSKTKGYHNVYNKDEYKKDTDFYDEGHKDGHFEKHSSFDENHKAAEGGFKKVGSHDSGYDDRHNEKKGYHDKGHHDSNDKGHEYEEGEDSYYNEHVDYSKENAAHGGKKHGYISHGHH